MLGKSSFHFKWWENTDQRMLSQPGPCYYLWLVTRFSFVHGFLKYLPWEHELWQEGFHARIEHFSNVESRTKCIFWYPWLRTRRIHAVARIAIASYFAFNWVMRDRMVHFSAEICPVSLEKHWQTCYCEPRQVGQAVLTWTGWQMLNC